MSEIIGAPYLVYEIEKHKQQIEERKKVSEIAPRLEAGFRKLLIKYVPFPKKIEGKKIKLISLSSSQDRVQVGKLMRLNRKLLSRTELECKRTSGEKEINITISSSVYPFEKWKGKDGHRPTEITVNIKELDCSFIFEDKAIDNSKKENEKRNEISIRYKNGDGKYEDITPNHVRILNDVLNLIQDPTTEYNPQPYKLISIPSK
jgi:hypothetical protein